MTDFRRWMILLGVLAFGWLVYALKPILMPFLLGALLAYIGNPLVLQLTRRGMRRTWAVSLAFFTLLTVVITSLVIFLPMLWRQLVFLESKVPLLLRWANKSGIPWLERHLRVDIDKLDMELIMNWITSYWQEAGTVAKDMLPRIAQSGLEMAGFMAMMALIPVVTFYLLLDWDKLVESTRRLIPRAVEPTVSRLARECDDVLAAFLRGQLLVMVALGIIYAVGLEIIGLDLALVIGMLAGLGSIIPYFGFIIGITAATITCLFQHGNDLHQVLLVWIVFGVGQIMEGWVLQPYLLGDRIGLPPVAVIFSVMAGGTLFGFMGMLLALPVAAIIMVLLRHAHERYLQSNLYLREPSVPEPQPESEHGEG